MQSYALQRLYNCFEEGIKQPEYLAENKYKAYYFSRNGAVIAKGKPAKGKIIYYFSSLRA
jgi:hypothetical protein